ncbi:hypothetical protein FRC07_015105 [Ceratobasidium sp. 392]|nr:hypothetical protein FRC07_015105 [Ceratobasidium sp. 392]
MSQTKLYMLDFNPHFLKDIEHRRLESEQKITNESPVYTKWVYEPAEINDVSPTGSNTEPHAWLAVSDADQATAPYAWVFVQNEEIYRVIEQGARMILVDAEHIIREDEAVDIVAFTL